MVYQTARLAHPERWSGATRNWSWIDQVQLNPDRVLPMETRQELIAACLKILPTTLTTTAIGTTQLTALADCGYFNGKEILACHDAGISTLVPPTKTSNAKADGRFDKADFVYDPQNNVYRCPAGQSLIWRFATVEKGMTNHRYWSSNCKACPLKEKCTPSLQRRVTRWEHQDVLEKVQARLEEMPDAMLIRRCTFEHPYGTVKAWMGATHFLCEGLERVKTEMSLDVLAYHLKRLIAVLAIADMMKAIKAFIRLQGLKAALLAIAAAFRNKSAVKRHGATQRFLALQT